jgi:hypothetical protein
LGGVIGPFGPAAGLGEGGGSSGLQPTTTIIASAALAKSDQNLKPNFAITDALLHVELVTTDVDHGFPVDTTHSPASPEEFAVQPFLVRFHVGL